MTGEVKLLNELKKSLASFSELRIGEGVAASSGTRVKIGKEHYFHFQNDGAVYLHSKNNWPFMPNREIRRFRLIAEEI